MISPQSFPNFGGLPVEIRLRIWRIIALSPRTLGLYIEHATYLHCQNPVPALLHVCQESREEGLKYYSVFEPKRCLISPLWWLATSPSWVTKSPPARIYISYERDTMYFSRWTPLIGICRFLKGLEEEQKIMPIIVALDLDHGLYAGEESMEDVYLMLQCWTECFPVAETIILVLPTDIGVGEYKGCIWKDIRFAVSQRARLAQNMTPRDLDLLRIWEKLLHRFEVKHCKQLESCDQIESYNKLESFEVVGLELVSLWERSIHVEPSNNWAPWVNLKIPKVRVRERVE